MARNVVNWPEILETLMLSLLSCVIVAINFICNVPSSLEFLYSGIDLFALIKMQIPLGEVTFKLLLDIGSW